MISLTLPVPPSGNSSFRFGKGHGYTSAKVTAYRRQVKLLALTQKIKAFDGPVSVSATFYRMRINRDLDNAAKTLMDALNGVAWKDDKQIFEMHLYRGVSEEARAEVKVWAI